MDIHPKRVFDLVSGALFFAGFILAFFQENLPEKILGLQKIYWIFLLFGSSVLVRFGWRVVAYFRRGE